jgi:hypothetical protein
MKKLILRKAVTAIVLLLIPGSVPADVKISLKVQGGWAYVSGGDVNRGALSLFDWEKTFWPATQGGPRSVHSGFDFGGDIIIELNHDRHRRRRRISEDFPVSVMDVSDPEAGITGWLTTKPDLSATPIRLGLFLNVPVSKKVNLNASIGGSCYLQARYSDNAEESTYVGNNMLVGWYAIRTRVEKKGVPLGFDGGVGIEYRLLPRVFLCFDAKGRYAKLRGLEGSSAFSDEFNDIVERGRLYYESVPMLAGSPRLTMVQTSPPAGPGGEPRQAVVDLSGISLKAGIRIRL